MGFFSKIKEKVKSLFSTPKIDTALKEQLEERGEEEKIKELEEYQARVPIIPPTPIEMFRRSGEVIKDTLSKVKELGEVVLQAPGRALVSIGLQPVADILSMIHNKKIEAEYQPQTKFERMILGDEPIKGIFKRTDDSFQESKNLLQKIGFDENTASGMSLAIAPFFVAGTTSLDLTPFGGEKNTIKAVARSKDANFIFDLIKPLLKGKTDDEIKVAAEELVKITKPEEVKNYLLKTVSRSEEPLEKAGNIRLSKINTSKEAEDLIRETAERNKNLIDEQRRGVITFEQQQKLADNLGITRAKLAKTKAGKAMNAEELIAANELLKFSAEDVINLRKAIEAGDNSDLALLRFRKALQTHYEVQKAVSGGVTEAGRALGALRQVAREIPTEQKAVKEMLDSLGGRELTEEIVKKFSKIDPSDILAVNKFIRDVAKVKRTDQLYWVWLNAILSNPITHIVNNSSNLLRALFEIPIKFTQAIIELPKPLLGKERQVFLGEIPYQLYGAIEGISEGVRKALFVLKEGVSPEMASKLDINAALRQPIRGELGAVVGMPTRALSAEDEFMKAVNGTAELNALAYRKATQEGLRGQKRLERIAELKNNPTSEMLEEISRIKLETTYQEELGRIGTAVMQLKNKIPGLRYIIPFIKTPTNIAKEALRISPLGFITAFKKVGVERSRALAKAIIGSLISASIVFEALKGNITGSVPKDKDEQDAFYREGKMPYSIKIGNKWYSYARLEPLATIIGLITDGVDIIKKGGDAQDLANKSVSLIAKNLNDKTFMTGISNALNAINDPERYGSNWIEQTVTGFTTPGIVKWISDIEDETIRNPEGLKEKIMARMPLLKEKIVPKRNVWGESIKREEGVIGRALSPIRYTFSKEDKVDQELKRLGLTINFMPNKLTISKEISDKLKIPEEKRQIKLTNEEYDILSELRGKVLKKTLDNLISDSNFQRLSDTKKEEKIKNIVTKIDTVAKKVMLSYILTPPQVQKKEIE